jgi:uncharacterized repeat protein (TIGR03809 family)
MTHRADVAHGRDVIARWCALAEQRLEYLTELFETGRWRRYHSEVAFLENIQEAKSAVKIWRDLSTREASRDNSAIDISWLGRSQTTLARRDTVRDQVNRHQPQPVQIHVEAAPKDAALPAETEFVASSEAPSAPVSDDTQLSEAQVSDLKVSDLQVLNLKVLDAPVIAAQALGAPSLENVAELILDLSAMQERYPSLRNIL